MTAPDPPLRVMALHALEYCERLFYLEEVEEIRVADDRVYAGRRLHEELAPAEDDLSGLRTYELSSEAWGLEGKLDAARRRDGQWIVYEHKRGRCRRGPDQGKRKGEPEAWPSDRLQAAAYAVLLEEELSSPEKPVAVTEARVRYHADGVTVRVAIDEAARAEVRAAVERGRALRRSDERPSVTDNERLCVRCSLKVVCLPEEERLVALGNDSLAKPVAAKKSAALFPGRREKRTLHVATDGSRVERSGRTLVVRPPQHVEGQERRVPIEQVDSLVLYGHVQASAQTIHACRYEGVAVQWITSGGRVVGALAPPGRVRQRLRQYRALSDDAECLRLSRALVDCKLALQLHYLLRATRGDEAARTAARTPLMRLRECAKKVATAESIDALRGLEGMAAKNYFAGFETLLGERVDPSLRFSKRTKRPPRDRLNALLSYGYALVHALVERTVLAVGLEPALGFYHRPRSAAPPLVLDLMEPFRTLLWEMPLVGSLNRGQWDPGEDFELRPGHVWLSEAGRRKAIGLFEARLAETHKHPHAEASLEYARIVELEVRLLEKEWTGAPGSFGRIRIR